MSKTCTNVDWHPPSYSHFSYGGSISAVQVSIGKNFLRTAQQTLQASSETRGLNPTTTPDSLACRIAGYHPFSALSETFSGFLDLALCSLLLQFRVKGRSPFRC